MVFLKWELSDPRKKLPCDWELDGKREPHWYDMAAPPTAPPGHNNGPWSSGPSSSRSTPKEESDTAR